jgi:GntR family transcriptional regulator
MNTAFGVRRARQQLFELLSSLPQGAQLPSERFLAEKFGVSRMTLRRTMEELTQEGHLVKQPRSRTFLQRPMIASNLKLRSFSEKMLSSGVTPSSRILAFREIKANRNIALQLQVEPESKLFRIKRIRFGDGTPIGVEDLYISQTVIPRLERKTLYGSLYDYFAMEYNIYVQHASSHISAYMPTEAERQGLRIDDRIPCLRMRMIDANQYESPFMIAECIYRSDRYEIALRVERESEYKQTSVPDFQDAFEVSKI